jgi:GTP cyclohydrolase III
MSFIYFDGDDVGPRLELFLLDNQIDKAHQYSQNITTAMCHLLESIRQLDTLKIIASGGDDLIVRLAETPQVEWVESLREQFYLDCGVTLSVGIGNSASEACFNLRRAKLQGKDSIVSIKHVDC